VLATGAIVVPHPASGANTEALGTRTPPVESAALPGDHHCEAHSDYTMSPKADDLLTDQLLLTCGLFHLIYQVEIRYP
jgi:hypothetical protein